MRIGVVGSGHVGGMLGKRWAALGHEVVFGSRHPESDEMQALVKQAGSGASAAAQNEAAQCEVVLLATPWPATETIMKGLGDLSGRVLIDATNPLAADMSVLTVGTRTSGGEQVALWAPGARVVKAFNTIGVSVMANPVYDGAHAAMFYCGDDAEAKATVHQLALSLGFDARDAGPLTQSRLLEPLALLWISLAFGRSYGTKFAFQVIGSTPGK